MLEANRTLTLKPLLVEKRVEKVSTLTYMRVQNVVCVC